MAKEDLIKVIRSFVQGNIIVAVYPTEKRGKCEHCGKMSHLWEVQTADGGSMRLGSSCIRKPGFRLGDEL